MFSVCCDIFETLQKPFSCLKLGTCCGWKYKCLSILHPHWQTWTPYLKAELQQNMHYTSNRPCSTKLHLEASIDKTHIKKKLLEVIWFCTLTTWDDRKKLVKGFSLEFLSCRISWAAVFRLVNTFSQYFCRHLWQAQNRNVGNIQAVNTGTLWMKKTNLKQNVQERRESKYAW